MDIDEAPATATETGDDPSVADVFYCASLLRVNPSALLGWVHRQSEPAVAQIVKRYTATFSSENPDRGVLVDNRLNRHAFFPSLSGAKAAASRHGDDEELPFIWRRNSDGEVDR